MAERMKGVTGAEQPVESAKGEGNGVCAARERTERSVSGGLDAETLKTIGAAVAAGIAGSAAAQRKVRLKTTLILILAAVLLIAGLFVYFRYIRPAGGAPVAVITDGLASTTIDFQNAVLGESREQKRLTVLEQDAAVDTTVSQTILDWEIFAKTRNIHSVGTGYYAVDLSAITAEDITADAEKKTVTITIPHAALYTVKYDVASSTYDDTERGLLAIGELKLTLEQIHAIETSIDDALHTALDTEELQKKADELAKGKVWELFQPAVAAISKEYLVQIQFKEEV